MTEGDYSALAAFSSNLLCYFGLVIYFFKRGIDFRMTFEFLDEKELAWKKRRNNIILAVIAVMFVTAVLYVDFLFVFYYGNYQIYMIANVILPMLQNVIQLCSMIILRQSAQKVKSYKLDSTVFNLQIFTISVIIVIAVFSFVVERLRVGAKSQMVKTPADSPDCDGLIDRTLNWFFIE